MQVEVESTGRLSRRLKVQVPAERVDAEVEKRLKSMGRGSKWKGFRPGKVPLKVLRQHYGDSVRREVLGEVMQTTYAEALAQESLNPAGAPQLEPVSTDSGADLEYTATFEIYPELELKGLEGLKLVRSVAEVAEADIDHMVENLRRQRAEWVAVERPAADGDRIELDFEGRRDGERFEPACATGETVELGSGRMIPDFESNLDGLSKGDVKTFSGRFPDDYHEETLRGTSLEFTVTVHGVTESRIPEVDDAFMRTMGIEDGDLSRMRSEIRESMERERDQTARRRLKDTALEAVMAANPIELPDVLVDQEIESLQSDSMARSGQDPKSLDGRPERELFEPAARRRVTLGLIIGEIIRSQNIVLDRTRVDEQLRQMSDEYQDPEAIIRAMRGDRAMMQRVELMVLEEQVLDWLVERADVTDRSVPFNELMNFEG
jgi:trigger factor